MVRVRLKEPHYPLLSKSVAAHKRCSVDHYSLALWPCTKGVTLPTARQEYAGELNESHCPLVLSNVALK